MLNNNKILSVNAISQIFATGKLLSPSKYTRETSFECADDGFEVRIADVLEAMLGIQKSQRRGIQSKKVWAPF